MNLLHHVQTFHRNVSTTVALTFIIMATISMPLNLFKANKVLAQTSQQLQKNLIAQNPTEAALVISERGRTRALVDLLTKRLSTKDDLSVPCKLALLVGINEYPNGLPRLYGCVNDVRLQKELLIHRFGFKDNDILTLTDKQATRKGILTAFEDHLIKQAKPGDVVVFHFSGHGSQVVDPDRDSPDGLNSTFIPIDSELPPGFPVTGGPVQDIMGHTLFLLMYALKTDNVTVVLDSCHSGGGTRGNFRVRSRGDGSILQPSNEELEYQKQWLGRLGLSKEKFIELRRKGVAKGVVIAAAKREQLASDASFSNFYAGAFTYDLTQYLWQQTGDEPVTTAIANVGRSTKELARQSGNTQEPEIEVRFSKQNYNAPIYFTRSPALSAEAVVTQVTGIVSSLFLSPNMGGLLHEGDRTPLAGWERSLSCMK
ncbi:peptidase C14 caspase catalytic subunit p20 [Tolypothrix sp. NIES-4075]|uniref:caspase family protein n=1 Tax=Tolypothrix sp. NIES-4075 TaxID=2005459 RepID=UPI000B64FD43|nr:caspase family protein [Tolypothrix sp. NIES-4075]GAX44259.1 peptidase C14 caspase catalytic subunit p20 [Tolypothrix sp. NIES-4075]